MKVAKKKKKIVVEVNEAPEPEGPKPAIPEPEGEKPKVRVVYKTDARYEVFKDAVTRIIKERPDAGEVSRNPMVYHEWALRLERLLQ